MDVVIYIIPKYCGALLNDMREEIWRQYLLIDPPRAPKPRARLSEAAIGERIAEGAAKRAMRAAGIMGRRATKEG